MPRPRHRQHPPATTTTPPGKVRISLFTLLVPYQCTSIFHTVPPLELPVLRHIDHLILASLCSTPCSSICHGLGTRACIGGCYRSSTRISSRSGISSITGGNTTDPFGRSGRSASRSAGGSLSGQTKDTRTCRSVLRLSILITILSARPSATTRFASNVKAVQSVVTVTSRSRTPSTSPHQRYFGSCVSTITISHHQFRPQIC